MRNRLLPLFFLVSLLNCKTTQVPPGQQPSAVSSVHLQLGNPSQADTLSENNYLLIKPQYVLSYNRSTGHANWVSWKLSASDLGESDRQDDFRPDPTLPAGWYRVTPGDYTNSGFDRGHLCPSADRTASLEDNSATFLMTNMIPQAPNLNRESWAYLEDYCRDVVKKGYRLHILAGTYGQGGEGSRGSADQIAGGKVKVPGRVWKLIVVLPADGDEAAYSQAEIIAVDFPNLESQVKGHSWLQYITTPAALETKTSYSFFQNVPATVRQDWRTRQFKYEETDILVDTKCIINNGRQLYKGPKGGCYYINASGNKSYVDRALCDC